MVRDREAGGRREAGIAQAFRRALKRVVGPREVRALAVGVAIAAFIGGVGGAAGEPSPLFVVTGTMTAARAHGTATVLLNGKVVFAGGQNINGVAQASVEVYDPATGQFNPLVATMSTARKSHTAVLLNNGTVLIAGGIDGKGNILNTAEVFDPTAETVTLLTGTMSDSRASHAATMLDNGQVLISGGQDAASIVNTAEIYDPGQGQFICVGGVSAAPPLCNPSMTDSRMGHTATLLGDGSVLMVGGKDNTGAITDSSERFTPADAANAGSGVFKPEGLMSDVRIGHTATLLNDDTVLIAGGNDGFDVVPTAEIYDPATGQFVLTGSSVSGATVMTTPRANHTATLQSDGTVALVGGVNNSGNPLSSAEIYNPESGTFSAVASQMSQARAFHTANLLASGLLLIAGGVPPTAFSAVSEAELLAPTPGFFVPNGAMVTARQFHTASTLFTGSTIVAGGQNALGPLASTELYDGTTFQPGPNLSTQRSFHTATVFPEAFNASCPCNDQRVLFAGGVDATGTVHADGDLYDTFSNLIAQGVVGGFSLGKMSYPRLGHTSTVLLITGMGFYAGGMTSDGSVLNSADIFNPNTGAFNASAGTMVSSRVFHTATQLLNGSVLLVGGRDTKGNILNTAEAYNPVADSFVALPFAMTDAREFHTATLLNSGQVLVAGGVDNNGATATAEIFDPVSQTFTAVGRMAVARYFHSAVLLPDGEVLIAGGEGNNNLVVNEAEIYNPATASFSPAASLMMSPRVGQAATMLLNGMVLFAGGADGGFNVTNSSELYDPPSGPAPAGALVSASKPTKATGGPGSLVNAGSVQVTNLSGRAEAFSEMTIASSQAAIFSRLALTVQVLGKSRHPQIETVIVKRPGAAQTFIFKNPLDLPPGGSVKFALIGTLGSVRKAGATPRRPVPSTQTLTALGVSAASGPMRVQGLPTGFGVVTLR